MASSSSRRVAAVLLGAALASATGAWAEVSKARVDELVSRLTSEDSTQRTDAARDLVALGPGTIAPLLDIVARGNLAEVIPIREVLPHFGPEAIGAFHSAGRRDFAGLGTKVMWREAVAAVARMGEPATPQIMRWFLQENPYGSDFVFARDVLLEMQRQDKRATPLLIELLGAPEEKVRKESRETAAMILASHPDARAYDALVAALESPNASVRYYAVQAVGRLRDLRAADLLLEMTNDSDSWIRRSAAAALGRNYEPRFRMRLGRMARNEADVMVRDTAANVLIYSDDPLAQRLGRRYEVDALSPARQGGIKFGYLLMLSATAFVVAVVAGGGLTLGRDGSVRARWIAMVTAVCALASSGVAWGGLVPKVTAGIEYLLLLVVAPVTAGFVFVIGSASGLSGIRKRLTVLMGSFYLGYGVGSLWLWGFL